MLITDFLPIVDLQLNHPENVWMNICFFSTSNITRLNSLQ